MLKVIYNFISKFNFNSNSINCDFVYIYIYIYIYIYFYFYCNIFYSFANSLTLYVILNNSNRKLNNNLLRMYVFNN